MPDAHKNFAVSAVATAPSPAASGTSLVVTSGHGTRFPSVPFNATIWPANSQPDPSNAEIVRVTAIATDTLTITRAQESSSARTVVVGDQIAATITAKTLTDVETPIVTSLPGSPIDGDEVYLKVGSGDTAILWHLKYDAAITDAHKWRFLGGTPLLATHTAAESTTSGTYVELTSGAPAVTLPTVGIYDFYHDFTCTRAAGAPFGIQNVKTNGTNPASDEDAANNKPIGSDALVSVARTFRRTVSSIATSALVVCVYRTDGGSNSFTNRTLMVTPVRLG